MPADVRQRIFGLSALALVLFSAASCARPKLGAPEAELVGVFERLRTERAGSRQGFRLLPCETAYASGSDACWSKEVRIGNLTIQEVHFRPRQGGGASVELQGLGPGCLRLTAIRSRFGGGRIGNQCSHGTCRYYTVEDRSDRLSFRLPDSSNARQCITNMVVNLVE